MSKMIEIPPFNILVSKLNPGDRERCLSSVDRIMDNLDAIQGLLGNKEYVKHLCYWEARKKEIENYEIHERVAEIKIEE